MLRFSLIRAARSTGSVLSPTNRSNTARGRFSIGNGVSGPRHAIVL
jgi:hypothetical protein